MKLTRLWLTASLGFGLATTAATGQDLLLIPDSTADVVMLFDANDGSLVDQAFLTLPDIGSSQTPVCAGVVGDEIWVTDQLADRLYRFAMDGTYLGEVTGAIDNIRGFEVVGDTVYVANAGTNNGAPGEAVVTFDTSGTETGSFLTGDPFDVLSYLGDLLINDINSEPDGEDLELFATDGTFLRVFHDSDGLTGIDFPEQMNLSSQGTVLVAGFSTPAGIYEYDGTGTEINYYDVGSGVRGVYELGNGLLLWTDGSGVHTYDRDTGAIVDVLTGVSGRYIEPLTMGGGGEFAAEIDGECPGEITINAANATPDGNVAAVFSPAEGITIIPGGICAGTQLDLASAGLRLVTIVTADSKGNAIISGPAPAPACGGFVQLVDAGTCATSNVLMIP